MNSQTLFIAAPRSSSLPCRIIGFFLTLLMLTAAAVFSVAALVVLAVVGAIGGAWLWWKTRQLRKTLGKMATMAEAAPSPPHGAQESAVIEGEWIREGANPQPDQEKLR